MGKLWMVSAIVVLAACATTNQQVKDAFDECISHGETDDRCREKAEAKRAELDGTPLRGDGVRSSSAPSDDGAMPHDDALPPECRAISGGPGTNEEARKQWDACELAKDRLQRKKAEDQRHKDRGGQ